MKELWVDRQLLEINNDNEKQIFCLIKQVIAQILYFHSHLGPFSICVKGRLEIL